MKEKGKERCVDINIISKLKMKIKILFSHNKNKIYIVVFVIFCSRSILPTLYEGK